MFYVFMLVRIRLITDVESGCLFYERHNSPLLVVCSHLLFRVNKLLIRI